MIRTCLQTVAALLASVAAGHAETVTVSTADNPFPGAPFNQGWWSETKANQDSNTNFFIGDLGNGETRNFFTFDLSPLGPDVELVSATLRVVQPAAGPLFGNFDQTVGLYDVSTDPAVLNANEGVSATIFEDLGTGASYGMFFLPGVSGDDPVVRDFALNTVAIDDLQAALEGFFSIGGRLESQAGLGLFADGIEPAMAAELIIDYRPVPEPTTVYALGSAMALLLAASRRL